MVHRSGIYRVVGIPGWYTGEAYTGWVYPGWYTGRYTQGYTRVVHREAYRECIPRVVHREAYREGCIPRVVHREAYLCEEAPESLLIPVSLLASNEAPWAIPPWCICRVYTTRYMPPSLPL